MIKEVVEAVAIDATRAVIQIKALEQVVGLIDAKVDAARKAGNLPVVIAMRDFRNDVFEICTRLARDGGFGT
jgi:hypothetical protein